MVRRRLVGAASTLINSISNNDITVPPDVILALQAAKQGAANGLEEAERAIGAALRFLTPELPEEQVSERQRELTAKLGEGEATATLSEWLAGRPPADDEVGQRLDYHMAELEAEAGPEVVQPFIKRAAAIAGESSPGRRRLLADSLVIDIAEKAREVRERAKLLWTFAGLASELSKFDSESAENVRGY